jgi:hypothetical protein
MIVANSLRKCLQATDSKQENSRRRSPQMATIRLVSAQGFEPWTP